MTALECVLCPDGNKALIPNKTLLCLGNFDGVHKAHRQLLRDTVVLADKLGATPAVWFFNPPASDFLSGVQNHHLSTLEEKLTAFACEGIRYAFIADFQKLRNTDYRDFTDLLKAECNAVGVSCGYDFRFGKDGAGTASYLVSEFGKDNVNITQMVLCKGQRISSTCIRNYLEAGDTQSAREMLNDFYSFTAIAVHGKHLGSTIGFPTANQFLPNCKLIPRYGVYASFCTIDGKIYPAVTNIGRRPTVDDGVFVNSESHIIGFSGDLYGKPFKTSLLCFIREERKFAGIEQLRAAIKCDVAESLKIYSQSEVNT